MMNKIDFVVIACDSFRNPVFNTVTRLLVGFWLLPLGYELGPELYLATNEAAFALCNNVSGFRNYKLLYLATKRCFLFFHNIVRFSRKPPRLWQFRKPKEKF